MSTWYALYTTGGTPTPVVQRLVGALNHVLTASDSVARIKGLGGEVQILSIEQFSRFNQEEFERYGQLIRSANVKAE
ncbi:tripartite tricarboxylate transporter substrate-binding protein [Pantoea sp. 18069]|uniref:tripartite tricarboxylate transporter substrate-binding protein n=1 Tax=Pantoea sp. 18069 TaxID=2681415 RepID=UPI0013581B92|nr:tripartite tricarboxylate transporter substrate-binding protein [Pantoea sp. 18069]